MAKLTNYRDEESADDTEDALSTEELSSFITAGSTVIEGRT